MKWYQDKIRMSLEKKVLERFPGFLFFKKGKKIGVKGRLRTPKGNFYNIKIIFPENYPNSAPEAYCLSHLDSSSPHLFSDKKLCYHYNEWIANYTIAVAIGWCGDWLISYEHWKKYGSWKGKEH